MHAPGGAGLAPGGGCACGYGFLTPYLIFSQQLILSSVLYRVQYVCVRYSVRVHARAARGARGRPWSCESQCCAGYPAESRETADGPDTRCDERSEAGPRSQSQERRDRGVWRAGRLCVLEATSKTRENERVETQRTCFRSKLVLFKESCPTYSTPPVRGVSTFYFLEHEL